MKRFALLISLLILVSAAAIAQDSYVYESDHYRVRSHISQENAQETAQRLEAYLELFNESFHFDLAKLDYKLRVQIFSDYDDYNRYLTRLIDETRSEFVYLHYSDASLSELVGVLEDGKDYDQSFTHQAFIQFLRAFIKNPPLWLREGFAVYFEEAEYDQNFATVNNKENLSWLQTLKDILFGSRMDEALPPDKILAIDVEDAKDNISVFYPEAWGIVNYLITTDNRSYNRILWDAISAMSPDADLATNSADVYNSAFKWVNEEELQTSFIEYFQEKKTYKELIESGIAAYEAGNLDKSEQYFLVAINRKDISHIPHYYLGLINYDRGNYALAELNYKTALDMGSTAALTYYALGVNAFADNRYDDAQKYLDIVVELDPANFSQKVIDIRKRMQS